ncbi:DUF647-domain-containing protein [Aulographum hederae CBS 113979]|uniref:DUF647-domain-containing protein n=1 Tax=Aulographum hederae CBS 113979 TaxID=1176131 RepID=A0A6G1HD17_9PEZI|nr:DUF647-domain-containing protein [Aulographum hederae CBS 113979]
MPPTDFEFEERDEAGVLTATYVQSGPEKDSSARVDRPDKTKTPWETALDVFLPAGYPQSVTEDYIQYQIYDSLQAFSSSIAGMLSSRAVLEGQRLFSSLHFPLVFVPLMLPHLVHVTRSALQMFSFNDILKIPQGVGVGDATASATGALLLNVLQESMGRIATILFAHKLGTSLEPECKMYRLAADIFNDTAMVLDCLSPAFPKTIRVTVLSMSSILRALCGVAAGSSKASLSAHFARWGNLGELNAKDSSQETVISLAGMLAGSIVVSWVSSPLATWCTLLVLLGIHLLMNHAAVRAVSMRSLNRQRANIVFSSLLEDDKVLTPIEVSRRERIFERDGALRWMAGPVFGFCKIGVKFQALLLHLATESQRTGSMRVAKTELAALVELFRNENYMLWYDDSTAEAVIVLKEGITTESQLKAWCHALSLARRVSHQPGTTANVANTQQALIAHVAATLKDTTTDFDAYARRLRAAGWDLEVAALETHSGYRLARSPKGDSRQLE